MREADTMNESEAPKPTADTMPDSPMRDVCTCGHDRDAHTADTRYRGKRPCRECICLSFERSA